MSYERARRILRHEGTDRVGHQETLDHPAFMAELVGFDPWERPADAYVEAYRALDVDWIFGLPKHAVRFDKGTSSIEREDGSRVTEWGLSGSTWREDYPVHTIEDVLAYEPLAHMPVRPESIDAVRADQARMGDVALVMGLFYIIFFMHPIMTFGWFFFLTAAAAEPDAFQRVLEDFAEVSRRKLEVWAGTDLEVVAIHDDLAMEDRLVFRPDWYRQRLFPLYEKLLEPLTAASQRMIFVSDGDYTPLLGDLCALGFDGFLVNDNMDLGAIARRHGRDRTLVGNVSTHVLTWGTTQDVRAEVARCLEAAKPAAGHFIKATRDLPHNIPLDNIRAYFEATAELGAAG